MTTLADLAINGGSVAFPEAEGKPQPKIGTAEFLSLAERFGFSEAAMERLRAAVSDEDLGAGPHLGRYYGSAKPSMGDRFEALAREQFGVKHAYAVCNGTCALQAALTAAGAGPGTEIIVPAMGFIATAMAGAVLGATPVYCDVDTSLQLDPAKLEALITPRTVAVLPTHHWGFVCDLAPVVEIAHRHEVLVIEDCAQAPGASYRGRAIGSIGDIGCFSISSYKIIGGGEGGMVITNDDRLFDRVCQAAEGGGLWRPTRFAEPRYEGELFVGSNYRASELESAINVVQMQKLPQVVARHRAVWHRIRAQLGNYAEIEWQKSNDRDGDIGYMLRFFPADDALGQQLAAALQAEGLGAGYRGGDSAPDWHVYRYHFPLFGSVREQCEAETCPVAADLYDRRITMSLSQWWTPADCDRVAAAINKVLDAYCTAE